MSMLIKFAPVQH